MNWLKRFHSEKKEVTSKKIEEAIRPHSRVEDDKPASYFLHLTSYSKFRFFTPVFLALFTATTLLLAPARDANAASNYTAVLTTCEVVSRHLI